MNLAFPAGDHILEDLGTLKIGFYSYEYENQNDDFFPLLLRLLPHQTWILATPLYWYSMSAQAKVFLDRLSDLLSLHREEGRMLRGKKFAVLCSGTDQSPPPSFSEPFSLTCQYMGLEFLGTHYTQFQGLHPISSAAGAEAECFVRTVARGEA